MISPRPAVFAQGGQRDEVGRGPRVDKDAVFHAQPVGPFLLESADLAGLREDGVGPAQQANDRIEVFPRDVVAHQRPIKVDWWGERGRGGHGIGPRDCCVKSGCDVQPLSPLPGGGWPVLRAGEGVERQQVLRSSNHRAIFLSFAPMVSADGWNTFSSLPLAGIEHSGKEIRVTGPASRWKYFSAANAHNSAAKPPKGKS